jgi:hypothetical protein
MKIIYQGWYEAFRILELVELLLGFPIEVHQFCSVQMHPDHQQQETVPSMVPVNKFLLCKACYVV